ncbi:MAG: type II secretion system protein [Alphaproteobacteria bacterium]|nr:type II secretion system protein [Alphaproteobacteria bacterium]
MDKNKIIQSGRSMVEMLGVLAIMGILSVGALSGYSSAMNSYRANKAIDEMHNHFYGIWDLFADKSNYKELTTTPNVSNQILQDAGILESNLNTFGTSVYVISQNITINSVTYSGFRYRYGLPTDNNSICAKILLSGWYNEFSDKLARIYLTNDSENYLFQKGLAPEHALPITLDGVNAACGRPTESKLFVALDFF